MKVYNKKPPVITNQDIRRYNWYIWRAVIAGFVFIVVMITLTVFDVFGQLPAFRDLENPKSNLASEVISSDKQILGTYYIQNRSNVTYAGLSPNVVNALVATEDKRFYEHSGIDFGRNFTIFLHLLIGQKQGGSTITQQLALNLFSEGPRTHLSGLFKKCRNGLPLLNWNAIIPNRRS